jgi:hypothetical protein
MNELIKTFDLSPEQRDTTALVQRLLGQRIADRYFDFCRMASGAVPLRVSSPMAGHALRELESILRGTLEVPMNVIMTPSDDEIERIVKATAQLEDLGFDDEQIQRVARELRPRLSHKEQIETIVTRLGLAPDGDIARAWKSISQAHVQAHGGRALHQSSVVDDTFRAEWQVPFEKVIRGLMIALQGKYAAFIQRVNLLAAMPDRGAAVTSFSKEIPGALPLLWHFFNQLQTPDWLPHLAQRNLLAAPQLPTDETGGEVLLLRPWAAGRYLLRMAKSDNPNSRRPVADALRAVATSTHSDVQQTGMEILAALPADEAAGLLDVAEAWLTPDARFLMALAPHEFIKNLAEGGQSNAALRATRAVFKVFEYNERLATLFSQHMYEHFLPGAVKALAPICKVETVALLADLLDQALRIGRRVTDDPPHDYTYYLSGEMSEEGIKHDVLDALVGEIIRAAKLALRADPACMPEIISHIRSHSPKMFTRIALHVLSLNPGDAAPIAQAYLTDPDVIERSWCRAEYAELARAWFPSLPATVQQQIFSYVDSVPDKYRGGWKKGFEEHEKRSPTPEEESAYDASAMRELLWGWRTVLPAERREAVEKLGDPEAWRHHLFEEPHRPSTAPNFTTGQIDEVIAFLETWRPSMDGRRETATALAQDLRSAAFDNPMRYSANASRFAHLPGIYVRNVLQGLANAAINQKTLDWDGALALVGAAIQPAAQREPASLEGDDPDWSWSRKAAGELFAAGLRQGAGGIPFANAERVQWLILELNRAAPRGPDTENFEDRYRDFPHYGAQSTERGAAVELAILLIFWLSKNEGSEVGKTPRAALNRLPEVRALLEVELADRTTNGRIPRAIIGRYLTWFNYFARPWLHQHFSALFPPDDLALRDATWLSHLSADSGPINDLADSMRSCYLTEIGRLGRDATAQDQQHVDDRLAEYVVILHIAGALANDVFEPFCETAPMRARQHAMWFLGIQLELRPDQLPDDCRARAISYWDRRLAAAKAPASPDLFREEIGCIGRFFVRKGIDGQWLMNQVISMSEAGFAPTDPYSMMDRLVELSPTYPDRAADVLAALVKNPRFDRYVYMTQSAAVRTILENGLATKSIATVSAVAEIINYLSTLGDTSYVDLLLKSPSQASEPP